MPYGLLKDELILVEVFELVAEFVPSALTAFPVESTIPLSKLSAVLPPTKYPTCWPLPLNLKFFVSTQPEIK